MNKVHNVLVLLLALCSAPSCADDIGIGVEISEYPQLVLVPDYPVYYAPEVGANYFFYDGDFWMYQNDNWYNSPWYDGPWDRVDPEEVPDIILLIPVRYYLQPPAYFFSWWSEEPPHWGEHWGHEWERHRHDWKTRGHRRHDEPAPLPEYQSQYSGDRYPRQKERQHELEHEHYHYQYRDPLAKQPQQMNRLQSKPAVQNQYRMPVSDTPMQHEVQRTKPLVQGNQATQHAQHREDFKEQGTTASPQPGHSDAQSQRQQDRPETVSGEQQKRRTEGAEAERPEREAGREQSRIQEKEHRHDR